MKHLLHALCAATLLTTSPALHAAATIQTAYYTIKEIVSPPHTANVQHNGFGEKPSIPEHGVTCSFTVKTAQPHKDVILDFCVKEEESLRTKWRITLGEQRDAGSDKPFSVHSEIEHLMPNSGNIIEQHECTHPAGKAFIHDGQKFHLRFGIKQDTISIKVFEAGKETAFLDKEFKKVPKQKYYLVPASRNSTVTYKNIVMWALPKPKK